MIKKKIMGIAVTIILAVVLIFVFHKYTTEKYDVYGTIFADGNTIYYENKNKHICIYDTETQENSLYNYKLRGDETLLDIFDGKFLIKSDKSLLIKDIDGKDLDIIDGINTDSAQLTNECIFFCNNNDNNTIYKFHLADKKTEKVSDSTADKIQCTDDYVYFSNEDTMWSLHRINLADNKKEEVFPYRYTVWYKVCDNMVYLYEYEKEATFSYNLLTDELIPQEVSSVNFCVIGDKMYYEQFYHETYTGPQDRRLQVTEIKTGNLQP